MKKLFKPLTKLCFVLAMLFQSTHSFSQTEGNEIIGNWWNQEKEAQIEIYKNGNTYSGKIIWLKEPNDTETGKPKLDKKNPDKKLRSRPILGSDLLYGFAFDKSENEWTGGTIYDAREGKTYKCYIKFNADKTLKVRGYIGAAWMGFGKTNIWTKIN